MDLPQSFEGFFLRAVGYQRRFCNMIFDLFDVVLLITCLFLCWIILFILFLNVPSTKLAGNACTPDTYIGLECHMTHAIPYIHRGSSIFVSASAIRRCGEFQLHMFVLT